MTEASPVLIQTLGSKSSFFFYINLAQSRFSRAIVSFSPKSVAEFVADPVQCWTTHDAALMAQQESS